MKTIIRIVITQYLNIMFKLNPFEIGTTEETEIDLK